MPRRTPPPAAISLWQLLREDLRTHDEKMSAGFHTLALHRLNRWVSDQHWPGAVLLRILLRVLLKAMRNVYGIELPVQAVIGRRVHFAHQGGIVINERCTIGDDCLIRHNVTLGAHSEARSTEVPTLGDRVQIAPGAVLVGGITIGDGALIGPNAVVTTDVPPGGRVVAQAARLLP